MKTKRLTVVAITVVAFMMVAIAPVAFAINGADDLILFNNTAGGFLANYSTPTGFGPLPGDDALTWGTAGDKPLIGDINGDGIKDVVLARPSGGSFTWYAGHGIDVGGISKMSTATVSAKAWGSSAATPSLADTNGDGIQDLVLVDAAYNWFSYTSSSAGIGAGAGNSPGQWGAAGDVPLIGDFNGDGAADRGLWRPSNGGTFIKPTVGGVFGVGASALGVFQNSDWTFSAPLIGDINGDGRDDMLTTANVAGALYWRAAFGQADGKLDANDMSNQLSWGATASDVPMLADINGDGMADIVRRNSGGTYYSLITTAGGVLGGGGPATPVAWGSSAFTPILENMDVVPEPAALGMLLLGGGALWIRKRLAI